MDEATLKKVSGKTRINFRVLSRRRNINMSRKAWDRLDYLCQELGWSRGKVCEFLLESTQNGEVKLDHILRYRNGMENNMTRGVFKSLITGEEMPMERTARGIFFVEDIDDILKSLVKTEEKFSVSNFFEQLFLHDQLLELYGLDFLIREKKSKEKLETSE